MPDITGLTALDVAVGLFFLYFVLSIVCSTLNELIASVLGWRSRNLELAIRHLLVHPEAVEAFWKDARVRALGHPVEESREMQRERKQERAGKRAAKREQKRAAKEAGSEAATRQSAPTGPGSETATTQAGPADAGSETATTAMEPTGAESKPGFAPTAKPPPDPEVRKPSYIPSRTFALTALDTLAPELAARARQTDAVAGGSHDAVQEMRELVGTIPNKAIQAALNEVLDQGRTHIDDLRAGLERHFDSVMDRASGWYKRRSQLALLCIAVVVTIAGNVDSVQVASKLWKDDTLRASVVQRATTATQGEAPPTTGELETLSDNVDSVGELGLPLGWQASGFPETFWGWLGKVFLGWPATILALSMGSAFWFDVLGKVARLRVAGKPEGTVKDDSGNKGPSTTGPVA